MPLDKDKIETVTNRNKRITKKSINLIFWNLIVQPHLLVDNYYSKFRIYKFKLNINKSYFICCSTFKIIFLRATVSKKKFLFFRDSIKGFNKFL